MRNASKQPGTGQKTSIPNPGTLAEMLSRAQTARNSANVKTDGEPDASRDAHAVQGKVRGNLSGFMSDKAPLAHSIYGCPISDHHSFPPAFPEAAEWSNRKGTRCGNEERPA